MLIVSKYSIDYIENYTEVEHESSSNCSFDDRA